MKIINTNNIDKWLFDYFEGNLSLHEKLEFENFIKENPSFQSDFNSWNESFAPDNNLVYEYTDSLIKKSIWDNKGFILFFSLALLLGTGTALFFSNSFDQTNTDISSSTASNFNSISYELYNNQNQRINYNKQSSNLSQASANTKQFNAKEEILNNDIAKNRNYSKKAYFVEDNNQSNYSNITVSNSSQNNLSNNYSQIVNTNTSLNNHTANNTSNITPAGYTNNNNNTFLNGINDIKKADINNKDYRRTTAKMYVFLSKYIDRATSINGIEKNGREYQPINPISKTSTDNNKKETTEKDKAKRNNSWAKSLAKFINRDLALTVFPNRLMLKDNLMTVSSNKSLTGSYNTSRVQLNGEKLSIDGISGGLSFDTRIKNSGLGLTSFWSRTENNSLINTSFTYSQKLDLEVVNVIPSATFSYAKNTNLSSNSLADRNTPYSTEHSTLDLGILIETSSLYAGIQTNNQFNLGGNTKYKEDAIGSPSTTLVVGTDYRKSFQKDILISPQFYVDNLFEANKRYTLAVTGRLKGIIAGVGASTEKDLHLVLGGEYKGFRIAYHATGYTNLIQDIGFSSLQHEIGLQFMISKKSKGYLLYD